MAADYVPSRDSEITAWATNIQSKFAGAPTTYGLVAGDVTPITTALAAWNTDYAAHLTEQELAETKRATKDGTLAALVAAIRFAVGKYTHSGSVTVPLSEGLGLTPKDTTPTHIGAPVVAPLLAVRQTNPLEQAIDFTDPTSTSPTAKPDGVLGIELHLTIGTTPPADPNTMPQVAMDTNTPYIYTFNAADIGKTAYWRARWLSPTGEHGPWSALVSGTITG